LIEKEMQDAEEKAGNGSRGRGRGSGLRNPKLSLVTGQKRKDESAPKSTGRGRGKKSQVGLGRGSSREFRPVAFQIFAKR